MLDAHAWVCCDARMIQATATIRCAACILFLNGCAAPATSHDESRTASSASSQDNLLAATAIAHTRPLFDVMTFSQWQVVGGDARFELHALANPQESAAELTLVGRGPIPRNGFLVSPRELGDFTLTVDVRIGSAENPRAEAMNSGIQIRSRRMNVGQGNAAQWTIGGLQIEIDPSSRAWSGGVYEECGRAWLASLAENEAARAAFVLGGWNRYEIECIGPRIRTKVNGVAAAQWFDATVAGVLAFQVHGGASCEVAFKTPMLIEHGMHEWRALADEVSGSSGERCAWQSTIASTTRGVRLEIDGTARVDLLADDGAHLASLSTSPEPKISAENKAKPSIVELLWMEGEGAALLDGVRVAQFACVTVPSRVRVLGESCAVLRAESLQRK